MKHRTNLNNQTRKSKRMRRESANLFVGTKFCRLVKKSQMLSRKSCHTEPEGPAMQQQTTYLKLGVPRDWPGEWGARCTWTVRGRSRGLWCGPTIEDPTASLSTVCQPEGRTRHRWRICGSPASVPRTIAGRGGKACDIGERRTSDTAQVKGMLLLPVLRLLRSPIFRLQSFNNMSNQHRGILTWKKRFNY
jgi:hypothetical protein